MEVVFPAHFSFEDRLVHEIYLCTALKVALVRSMSPPVGLSTSPRTPFPVPFNSPHTPSFLAPTHECIHSMVYDGSFRNTMYAYPLLVVI